jgi:hypothetical protein
MSYTSAQEALAVMHEIIELLDGAELKITSISQKVGVSGESGGGSEGEERNLSGGISLRTQLRDVHLLLLGINQATGSSTLAQGIRIVQATGVAVMRLKKMYELLSDAETIAEIATGNPMAIFNVIAHGVGTGISISNAVQMGDIS